MRFGLPRSASPSPSRGYRRGASTFGLHSDSESDDEYGYHAFDYNSDSSSSSSSPLSSASSSSSSPSPAPNPAAGLNSSRLNKSQDGRVRSPEETREKDEAIASIRLWTRHRDPYEEWEKQTRQDAFKTARRQFSTAETNFSDSQMRDESLAQSHAREMSEIEQQLSTFRLQQEREEADLREKLKVREKELWARIEAVIQIEEDKVKARLEEERKRMEEEEKKKREEELKRKEEAEREEERLRKEKEEADAETRKKLGYQTPSEDWTLARESLLALKGNVMAVVKSDKALKSEWSKVRRQITSKVGQITNDEQSIETISTQLLQLIRPNPPHKPIIYAALCNSLAKAILLQAETEVTAEKRAAIPLARVTFNMLTALEMFPEFLWPKLVQRVGGWPVPAIIPETDIDGRRWGAGPKGQGRGGERERHRVMGYRPGSTSDNALESPSEYSVRVAGIMRVYWEIVKVQLRFPERAPPLGPFAMPKVWVWFARILDSKALMDTAVCAELIYTALEVIGMEAADIWGVQWIKILQLIYEGTSTGVFGQAGKLLGGDSPEGKAAKARIQMEIERIVSGRAK
ncbi:hypothetical protein FA13DRAFT_1733293 [Coprinellus micaceus]|uniref:mRNA export factor GLE1 n=1 Tax=Coprinellus micaceus TaxID=71717 RepID=A0A4Y7TAB8_COPMI|nr:hypothetical protein FA13DRAFT_1733293 [Coprinellus micaceus]